ncbi:sulfurtransferase complex subunit TusB, partial [Pseudomonas syringae pv. tagetis]|uniref:sulfurtransferase complex subunit TusB n=1 Tax=Pseudomonas syringae group genomosp. 7 TaxID=251699 RepID=UPI00376F7CAC
HVLSHSPFADTRLDICLRLLGNVDGVLLCGDATYALMQSSAPFLAVQHLFGSSHLFVLYEDIKARNLQLPALANGIDYPA